MNPLNPLCSPRSGPPCVPLGQIPVAGYPGPMGSGGSGGGSGSGIQSLDLKLTDIINLDGPVPITKKGKLALAKTGVVAGTYVTPANLEVDATGRIFSVSDSGPFPGVLRIGNTSDAQVAVWVGNNLNAIRAVPVEIDARQNRRSNRRRMLFSQGSDRRSCP